MAKTVPPQHNMVVGNSNHLESQAQRLVQAGKLGEAEPLVRRLLALNKNSPAGLFMLGVIELEKGARDQAESLFRRCIKIAPRHFGAHANLGNLLLGSGKCTEALATYRVAIKLQPDNHALLYNTGQCLRTLGRLDEAIATYRRALGVKPDFITAACDLGIALALAGKSSEALALGKELIQRHPGSAESRIALGKIFRELGRSEEARIQLEDGIRLDPHNRTALWELAAILIQGNELGQAESLIRRSVAGSATPVPGALMLLAELRARQGNHEAAIGFMSQALDMINPYSKRPQHFLMLAAWHAANNDRAKAVEVLSTGLKIFGAQEPGLTISLFYNQLCLGDWTHFREQLTRVLGHLRNPNPPVLEPFVTLLIPGLNPSDLQRITHTYAHQFASWTHRALPTRATRRPSGERLRIGYLSADFHQHATAYLTAAVFEHHDPSQFEIHAYSYGPDDGSATRQRLRSAFEHFVDIRGLDHALATQRIRDDDIDILVDLKGYTRQARPEILARRPAPIQVNWLGYPGTMAADFMDYIIVDSTVVPPDEASYYQEALAYLPHAYAPVDRDRPLMVSPSRVQAGLPEEGFVYCCFNNPRKITPDVFQCWCELLSAVPKSVLWLFARQEPVIDHLRREAGRRGIHPHRILFAGRVPQEEHLARLHLADLILDTLPYNAHTTTSDALLVGVPVLTRIGITFPGRVAASLLRAAGMADLITFSLEEYQAKALHLATHPEALLALRQRLVLARNLEPYFDVAGFTRDLESIYRGIWQRHEAGLKPALLPPRP
jgi:protein O-GlcNAc transferase